MHHSYTQFATRSLSLIAATAWMTVSTTGFAADKTAVRTVAVAEENVERSTIQPATVHPYYTAEIEARLAGYISAVNADIGDAVDADALLATIDVPEMSKQQDVSNARILQAEAKESQAEAGVALAEANVESAKAKQRQAESERAAVDAAVAAAESEFQRTEELVDRQSVQQRMLDEVRQKRDSQLARRLSIDSAVDAAKADVAVAEAKLAAAKADMKAAKAETLVAEKELEELEELMKYAQLKAPFPGIVTHRAVDPGDLVRETTSKDSAHPLFVVSQVNKVRVRIPVPEADAAFVQKGDSVLMSFPSFPQEKPLQAKVTRSSGSLDPSTRTMLVEADVENSDGKLIPGMFGRAKITMPQATTAQTLPARAVRFGEAGKAFVYVVGDDNKVSVVDVATGADNGTTIEIRSGLTAGQRVIDAHIQRFSNGDEVRIIE